MPGEDRPRPWGLMGGLIGLFQMPPHGGLTALAAHSGARQSGSSLLTSPSKPADQAIHSPPLSSMPILGSRQSPRAADPYWWPDGQGSDQSSDRFITIQAVSMDASCNRVQDRNYDFFP